MKGCLLGFTIALLVAAPQAAQPASQDAKQTHEGKQDGNAVKDSWLTTKVKSKLFADSRVKGRMIHVETSGAVVMLRGKVETAHEKMTAEDIVRHVDGVKSVQNVLQVVPDAQRKMVDAKDADIQTAVQTRLSKDDRLKDADIKVRADNGLVTLMGTVPDARMKARANDLARGVPGVKAVRNELRQKS